MNNMFLTAVEQGPSMLLTFLPFFIILFISYFMLVRPQKKRDQELRDMRAAIEIGDEVVTVGGIIGRVVSIKDETFVIETGTDRSKIRLARWAIQANNSAAERKAEK